MKVGMIGCGNMGGALASAAAKSVGGCELMLADQSSSRLSALSTQLNAVIGNNREIAGLCEYIFLGVKPQVLPQV